VSNAGYCLFLIVRNRSWKSMVVPGVRKACGWAVFTGVIWFATFGVYGLGAAGMGDLGNVIGWPILLGLGLIVSNGWSLLTGEWKNAAGPLRIMGVAVVIIIVACVIFGLAKSPELLRTVH
jgi:L-rhamnose-H+ transport protein